MQLNASNLDEHIGKKVRCVIENKYIKTLKKIEGTLNKGVVLDCLGTLVGKEGMYIVIYDTESEHIFTHFTFSKADMGDDKFLHSIETI